MDLSPWLLIPAAVLLILLISRFRRRSPAGKRKKISSLYFKGLNYLLNEQPDKAIDTFIQVLKADSETVELHLALGNLYRRKGNIERATRIHQSLIVRSDLDRSQRANALYELGQDYYKAGLLDRAENLFLEFISLEPDHTQALRLLISIYEQEKEWDSAANIASKLIDLKQTEFKTHLSHYYCELAENKIDAHLGDAAVQHLKKALATDKQCARAYYLLARVAIQRDKLKDAEKHWKKIWRLNPGYFDEIVNQIVDVYTDKQMDAALENLVRDLRNNPPGMNSVFLTANWYDENSHPERAQDVKFRWIKEHPSAAAIAQLTKQGNLQLQSKNGDLLTESLQSLLEQFSTFQCDQCGYECNINYWQCPGCHQWDSIRRRN